MRKSLNENIETVNNVVVGASNTLEEEEEIRIRYPPNRREISPSNFCEFSA